MVFKKLIQVLLIGLFILPSPNILSQEKENEEEYHHYLPGESSLLIELEAPYSFELKTTGIKAIFYYGMEKLYTLTLNCHISKKMNL
jgi:hypothetical protein